MIELMIAFSFIYIIGFLTGYILKKVLNKGNYGKERRTEKRWFRPRCEG